MSEAPLSPLTPAQPAPSTSTPRPPAGTNFRRRLAALPVALVAILLLALGLPRTVGVLVAAQGEPVLRKLQEQQAVHTADLRLLIEAQQAALPWLADGRVRTDLGLAHLLLAETLPRDSPDAATSMQQAIAALQAGLALSPASPYAWSRLAYAEAIAHGWSPLAVAALRLALITAPYEPPLLWARLRMTFLAWPEMPGADREMVFQQIRYAWQADREELVRLAVQSKQVNLVRAALLRIPEDGLAFEQMVKARR